MVAGNPVGDAARLGRPDEPDTRAAGRRPSAGGTGELSAACGLAGGLNLLAVLMLAVNLAAGFGITAAGAAAAPIQKMIEAEAGAGGRI